MFPRIYGVATYKGISVAEISTLKDDIHISGSGLTHCSLSKDMFSNKDIVIYHDVTIEPWYIWCILERNGEYSPGVKYFLKVKSQYIYLRRLSILSLPLFLLSISFFSLFHLSLFLFISLPLFFSLSSDVMTYRFDILTLEISFQFVLHNSAHLLITHDTHTHTRHTHI